MIKAECHSDDRCVEIGFDATPGFENASDDKILALAEFGWGGDYAADDVAIYMADQSDGVKTMFNYLDLRGRIETIGFECHVNEDNARKWISENRPLLTKSLDTER
jgi:hypothetical protein